MKAPHKFAAEIKHFVDGGGVEIRKKYSCAWTPVTRLDEFLTIGLDEARIKPKPRELWAVYDSAGRLYAAFTGRALAKDCAKNCDGARIFHMVEAPE